MQSFKGKINIFVKEKALKLNIYSSYFKAFSHGAFSRTRTYDPAVNSRMLYRLSYKGSQRDYYINICRAFCQEFFIKNKLNFYVFYLFSLSSEIALRSFSSCSFISSFLDFTP